MDTNQHTTDYDSDILTAKELAKSVFRCSYHTFMTVIKTSPKFPNPIGNPNVKGKLFWFKEEVIQWRNDNYRRVS